MEQYTSGFIKSERLYFREIRKSDVGPNYYKWMNDKKVTEFLESRFYPWSLESIQEFVEVNQNNKSNLFLAIILIENEKERHIGNIKLSSINWLHRHAELGLLIGEQDCWGKGFATEAIEAVTKYAFEVLNLHKVIASCYESNIGSKRAFEKAGFTVEGIRKSYYFSQGKFVDSILLGIAN